MNESYMEALLGRLDNQEVRHSVRCAIGLLKSLHRMDEPDRGLAFFTVTEAIRLLQIQALLEEKKD